MTLNLKMFYLLAFGFLVGLVANTQILAQQVDSRTDLPELCLQTGHSDKPQSIAFRPKSLHAISTRRGQSILWNAETGLQLRRFEGTYRACSADGMFMLTTSGERAFVWEVSSGYLLKTLIGHKDNINTATFSPDGALVMTGADDNSAILWKLASGQQLRRLTGHKRGVSACCFSTDGVFVATGSEDLSAILWETSTGKEIMRFERGHKVFSIKTISISKNGLALALNRS